MDYDIPMFGEKNPQIFCAVALDDDGTFYDGIYNWETAETLALEGYTVIAVNGDGYKTVEEIQALCEHTMNLYNDCFGRN